jgi:hypothetical protein
MDNIKINLKEGLKWGCGLDLNVSGLSSLSATYDDGNKSSSEFEFYAVNFF